MTSIFYKPSSGNLADVIPFYDRGEFHLFYLHDYKDHEVHGEGTPWFRISTRDFIHYEEHGEMIPRGNKDEQDLYVFTGCVIKAKGLYHIFYTGHNPHFPKIICAQQGIMHAVSEDLKVWKKLPEDTFFAPAQMGYEPHDWRDPFVFYDDQDGGYHMLLAARTDHGPSVRRGITAHLVSGDLKKWDVIDPLWAPSLYYTHECPDLFRMGSWYYLIFSEFTDRCQTRYVMSRSLYGPWISPVEDTFDSRCYYAAKTCSDGVRRYLFGWSPARLNKCDNEPFIWGGNLVVHELHQDVDGTLRVKEVQSRKENWINQSLPEVSLSKGAEAISNQSFRLCRLDGYCQASLKVPVLDRLRISFEIKEAPSGTFGLRFFHHEHEDVSMAFIFETEKNYVRFDRMPNHAWRHIENAGLIRHFSNEFKKPMTIVAIVEETLICLYINDEIAFSARAYEQKGEMLSFFCTHGEVTYDNLAIMAWKD